MKHVVLIFSALAFSLSCFAQMEDKFWVLVGTESVNGNYTGISPQVADDSYKLSNLLTSRMEMMGAKGNAIVDISFNSIWLFNMNNDYRNSSLTENSFHKVQSMPLFRLCLFRLTGDESSEGFRFGAGGQIDVRKMGLANNSDNNGFSAFGAPGLSYGPLELKARGAIGANLHLVKQSEFIYTRFSLNADYCPGKIKDFAIYPEATLIANYNRIALFGIATYRTDFVSGNRQTSDTHSNQPEETSSVARELRLQIGFGVDLDDFISKK